MKAPEPPPSQDEVAPSNDDAVQQWFIRRGVPHFIDPYVARTDIWARALPVLVVTYVAGGLLALDLHRWSVGRNVLAGATILAVLALTWMATNALRRRPLFARPRQLGAPELAAFLIGPAVPSALFGQWGDAVQAVVEGAVVLAAVYVITSYGLVPLSLWAIRRSADQIGALGTIVARGLPLLLLFTMFLFINADVWQMASQLVGVPYVATVGVFFVLGAGFVVSRIPDLTAGLNQFEDWADVAALVADTPGEQFAIPDVGRPPSAPLGRRQRLNVALVSVISQALQIALVAVLLTAFFVGFGLFAISPETTATWTRPDIGALATFHLAGRSIVLTEPLLRVAGFLGAFSGMYFTVVLATDATYRDAFSDDVAPQIRQALAVRVAALHCGA